MTPLTCEQAVKQFFAYLDRALSGEPLGDFETHLEACLSCCEKLAFSRDLDAFVKSRLPDADMPERLEARVREALARLSAEA
ncbi:MAG: zf-HC2 domain-containing protein [Candidatus Rokubacteria bacterium]|nr:zf-HC2 domain-containing protein [Candidatus Rokubacteria bacterium]